MGDDLQIEIYNRTSGLLIDVTDIDATVTDVTVLSDVTRTPHGMGQPRASKQNTFTQCCFNVGSAS